MAVKQTHKRISMSNPNEFIALVIKKASSVPMHKKMLMFAESVILLAANGERGKNVRCANNLIPGKARVAGSADYSFGYLWESTAIPADGDNTEDSVTGTCFMTTNDRGLFDRLYGNNEDAEAALKYADFIANQETTN